MLDLCLLGSGGMMPLPRRWLTALMTRYNGSSLLIDCGEGTQVAVKERGWSFKPIDVILLYIIIMETYQWTSGITSYYGKCGSDRATYVGRTERIGTGCKCP